MIFFTVYNYSEVVLLFLILFSFFRFVSFAFSAPQWQSYQIIFDRNKDNLKKPFNPPKSSSINDNYRL